MDGDACRCAQKNGVEIYQGDLGRPIPGELRGHFDVVVAVVPYVPTDALVFLPRDVRRYEPVAALDGGRRGLEVLEQAVEWGRELLHAGGALILELGGEQDRELLPRLGDAVSCSKSPSTTRTETFGVSKPLEPEEPIEPEEPDGPEWAACELDARNSPRRVSSRRRALSLSSFRRRVSGRPAEGTLATDGYRRAATPGG